MTKDISKLKVTELREELTALGLPTKGVKKDLQERLKEALEKQSSEAAAAKETETSKKSDAPAAPAAAAAPVATNGSAKTENGDTKDGKKKKKKRKKKKHIQPEDRLKAKLEKENAGKTEEPKVEIEYVLEEQPKFDDTDPSLADFAAVFQRFQEKTEVKEPEEEIVVKKEEPKDITAEDDDDSDNENEKMSKTKLRKLNRLSVAELKQLVERPDVVETWDVTASDPRLLIVLKGTRNSVPVPRHWANKRKYLQGKRGIEKAPFELPDFIRRTGISEMRDALAEKEDAKGMAAKMREKTRPSMGKIEIDYQKLHDAFFRWQTKPIMTGHGDLYYEGKEFETKLKEKKPGDLSDELRTALGMPVGKEMVPVPPPWLLHMQRYGPPPSYPNLKIPGLNAPIPGGASFGFHPGGWGKPPVDELGRPLYGDVFGTSTETSDAQMQEDDDVDKKPWGQLESEDSESEDESEEGSDDEADAGTSGLETPSGIASETPSGISSINTAQGLETPDAIELRQRRNIEAAMESGEQPSLYQVIPERKSSVGSAMMGSTHVYDLKSAGAATTSSKSGTAVQGTEVSIENPDEFAALSEEQKQERLAEIQKSSQPEREDFSDMVAEHQARAKQKRKKSDKKDAASKKFKF